MAHCSMCGMYVKRRDSISRRYTPAGTSGEVPARMGVNLIRPVGRICDGCTRNMAVNGLPRARRSSKGEWLFDFLVTIIAVICLLFALV